eukprot:CAMPEP_0168580832 /NCGR_PEP_ID=MMETSP0420-20121227/1039_1 /TAXON_ID=498008 /ORGANISM="Pessonella sp." /LENGTH=324 /DNA_ID=CAMNT_0008615039 /DNA_START=97 /DNA_END=1071 /DNA_ORIENTATION=-
MSSTDMTLEEKQQLSKTINEMTMSSLTGVVEILMTHLPELKDQAGNEIKIDLDGLNNDVLRELEAYAKKDAATARAPSQGGGPAKKARTGMSKKEQKAKEKAAREKLLNEQKVHILAGCEKVLRAAGAPLTIQDLVIRGTDAGYFYLPGPQMPDALVKKVLNDDIKAGSHAGFVASGKDKYTMSEFTMPEPQKSAQAEARKQYLATQPPFATPATDEQKKLFKAKYVLQDLAKSPNAWIFAAPVNAKELNLPDYHTVITEPMDMGTVKTHLNEGRYNTLDEFKRELDLTWTNAMKYNPATDPVHQYAAQFQKDTQQLYQQYGLA